MRGTSPLPPWSTHLRWRKRSPRRRARRCSSTDRPAEVSSTAELDDSILATGFAYNRNALADNNLDNVVSLGLAAAGLRRFGSAALDLAYTACGRLDGYWELHLEPWGRGGGNPVGARGRRHGDGFRRRRGRLWRLEPAPRSQHRGEQRSCARGPQRPSRTLARTLKTYAGCRRRRTLGA